MKESKCWSEKDARDYGTFEWELSRWLYSNYRGEDIKPIIEIFKKHGYLHKDNPTDVMVDGKPRTVGEVLEDYKRLKEQKEKIIKFVGKQKDLPPEFAKLINEHFWELV